MKYNDKQDSNSRFYSGTPFEVINQLSRELGDILAKAGFPCTPLHALALFHTGVGACAGLSDDGDKGPSIGMLLPLLAKRFSRSDWTKEEIQAFDTEFIAMVKAMSEVSDVSVQSRQVAAQGSLRTLTKDKDLGFLSPAVSE